MPKFTFDDEGPYPDVVTAITNPNPAPPVPKFKFDEDVAKTSPPVAPGFLDRIGTDLSRRGAMARNIAVRTAVGETPLMAAPLELLGKVGYGAANDIAGETLDAVTPDVVKNIGAQAVHGTANAIDSTGVGQYLGDKLMQGTEAYKNWAQGNPNASDLMDAAANIAGFTGATEPAAMATAKGTGKVIKKVLPEAVPAPIEAEVMKTASQNAYKAADDTGGILHPDKFTNNALDVIEKAKAKPIAGKLLTKEQQALNDSLDEYKVLRDTPLTLSDYENLDKSLGAKESAAMDGFKSTANSRIIGQVQDALREKIKNLKSDEVVGGKEGFDILTQHAIPAWATQAKMQELEHIVNRANMMDNPSIAMRTGFKNLSLNKSKMASYPPSVQVMIRKAATQGSADDILGILGSRLNPIIGGAVGGTPGAAVSMATSKGFRAARTALQNRQANKIMNALTEPMRPTIERFGNIIPNAPKEIMPEPQKLLSAPEPTQPTLVPDQATGSLRPMTQEEQADSIMKRRRAETLGLTPGTRSSQLKNMVPRIDNRITYDPQSTKAFQNAPTNETVVTPSGNARPATRMELAKTDAERANYQQLGLTPDVLRVLDRMKHVSAWDRVTQAEKNIIGKQIQDMWVKNPQTSLADMVKQAKKSADYRAAAKNSPSSSTSMGEAFKRSTGEYAKGGHVKRNLTAEFLARAS